MIPYPRSSRKGWSLIKLVLLALVISAGVYFSIALVVSGRESAVVIQETTLTTESVAPKELKGTLESRFMFSGTVVTARAVENEARDSSGTVNWASVFSQFASFQPEKYSEWFIDMECPVTTNTIPYRTQVENTVFNCPPSVFPEMSKFITVANIANNHTRDQGDDGFTETRKNVLEGGLQAVGNWDPREKDDLCEVMGLTYTLTIEATEPRDVEVPIAVCAFHYFEKEPRDDELDEVSQYSDIMPVIGLMQVGVEYRPNADDRQIEVGRALIDRGVDFVVGNSPHWVQNTEVYKDKLIVYSTGNFIFDQLDDETNRGLNLDVQAVAEYNENLESWIELGKNCKPEVFKDDCFQQAKQNNLEKVNFSYNFSIVASTGGFGEITARADSVTQAAVEVRANWAQSLSALGQ